MQWPCWANEIWPSTEDQRGLEGELQMADEGNKKCAHIPCKCKVPAGQKYCGEACRDASSKDVEIACQCDHSNCPLTV
jgi:hypothetical protein